MKASHRVVPDDRPGRLHHLPPKCVRCGKVRVLPPGGERWIHADEVKPKA